MHKACIRIVWFPDLFCLRVISILRKKLKPTTRQFIPTFFSAYIMAKAFSLTTRACLLYLPCRTLWRTWNKFMLYHQLSSKETLRSLLYVYFRHTKLLNMEKMISHWQAFCWLDDKKVIVISRDSQNWQNGHCELLNTVSYFHRYFHRHLYSVNVK